MKVLIISSSRDEIDDYYKSIAKSIAKFLSDNENDLIFGASSSSMMGICYDEFKKNNCHIDAYTTPMYVNDLKNLEYANHIICKNTFELKQQMFIEADMIVALPGGIGTLSEILSFIEEKRSNCIDKPILIYDESHFYEKLFMIFEESINEKFVSESIKDEYEIATNRDEFINKYLDIKCKKGRNRK